MRLGLGRGGVVGVVVGSPDAGPAPPRRGAASLLVAGDQAQGRGVDRRVVAAGPLEDREVPARRGAPPASARSPASARQRPVLGDPRAERAHVLVLELAEPVGVEAPRRLLGRARARQAEHGPVAQPEIVGMLGEPALGEVDRLQQLTAPLGIPDLIEPPRRGDRDPGADSVCRAGQAADLGSVEPGADLRHAVDLDRGRRGGDRLQLS